MNLSILSASMSGLCVLLGAGAVPAAEFEDAIVYPVGDAPITSVPSVEPFAEPHARHHFDEDPFYLELRLGWATTVGELGVVGEYDVLDRLALGAGFGSNGYGSDAEIHARFRPVIGASKDGRRLSALTLEGALTNGSYDGLTAGNMLCGLGPDGSGTCIVVAAQRVFWAQLELGWEMRLGSGMTVRVSTGGAALLGTYHWRCSDAGAAVTCSPSALPTRTLFTQTIGWGVAF